MTLRVALPILVASSAVARADLAVTTQPLALVGRGIAVGYERLVTPRLSIVGLAGARATALGDFRSRTLSGGAELRFWPRERAHRRMRGLYLALHATIGRTALVDETTDTMVGSSIELTQRFDAGWRFQVWRGLTIAPSLGVGVHQDFSARLATFYAPTVMLGFELGWLR